MADESFREIQLSGKQLIALFMAAAVVLIATFLSGVLVGRGVRSQQEPAISADAAQASGGGVDPTAPPTPVKPAPQAEPQVQTPPSVGAAAAGGRGSRRPTLAARPSRLRLRLPAGAAADAKPKQAPASGLAPAAGEPAADRVLREGRGLPHQGRGGQDGRAPVDQGLHRLCDAGDGQGRGALQRARRQVPHPSGSRGGQAASRTRGAAETIDRKRSAASLAPASCSR